MTTLQLILPDNRTSFEPGESIQVLAEWMLEPSVTAIELRLMWTTSGKGGTDQQIVQRWPFENPTLRESKIVDVKLPDSPYSFSGKLISLSWTFELIAQPFGTSVKAGFILSPTRSESLLHQPE